MRDFSQFHFSGQKAGEEVLLVVHRHWFNILAQMFIVLVMILFLIGGYLFLPALFSSLKNQAFHAFFLFLQNIFAIFIWIIFFLIWIDYYFDIWIITNRRVVNIEQKGLFSRDASELELEKIQDITTEVRGVIPTFLNFGDVYIQTAAEKERFLFRSVPDPYSIKDLLMNLQKKAEDKEARDLGKLIKEQIEK